MAYMLTPRSRHIAEQWEKYKGTTIRPYRGLLRLFDSYAKKVAAQKRKPRLLVIGGTPELRSIGAKYGFEVFAADRSLLMLDAMRRLCDPKPKNETMIVSDWLRLKLPKKSFDLILGDDSINMLQWKRWPAFMEKFSALLKDDGLMVLQVMVEPPKDKLVDIATVAKRWHSGRIKTPGDLVKYLNYTTYNRRTYSSSFQKHLRKLKRLRSDPLYAPIWKLQERYEHFNSRPTHPPRKAFESLCKKYLRIIHRNYVNDFEYCKYEPVYVLGGRS